MTEQPFTKFSNGNSYPTIGLGTAFLEKDQCIEIVKAAILEHGYRSIDTASIYKNEEAIGQALHEIFETGKVKREEICVTTKFWHTEKSDIEGALKRSLDKLKL